MRNEKQVSLFVQKFDKVESNLRTFFIIIMIMIMIMIIITISICACGSSWSLDGNEI